MRCYLTLNNISISDYYPFGMLMPNRYTGDSKYKYGFQGQEMDDEVKGKGTSANYKYRMNDTRIGRFFTCDPLESKYPWYTPYQFSGNKVISAIELEGLEEFELNGQANINARWNFGGNGTSYMSIGFSLSGTATYTNGGFSAMGSANASFLVTDGGMTMPFGQRQDIAYSSLTISPGLTIGGRTGNSIGLNYLDGNATTSLSNPIKNSLTYTQNFHLNSENRYQRTGTWGLRFGDVSLNVLEDHKGWFGDGEDRWYTGSGNLNFQTGIGTFTIGTDTYTGNSINSFEDAASLNDTEFGGYVKGGPGKGRPYFWANQSQVDKSMGLPIGFNQTLNNAQTYLKFSGNHFTTTLKYVGPTNFWSQNGIHNSFMFKNYEEAFHHFKSSVSKNSFQAAFSVYMQSK